MFQDFSTIGNKIKVFFYTELELSTKEKIKKVINTLRNNEAPVIDSLESELFKADPKIATDQLHVLFTKIWDLEVLPKDWCNRLIMKLPKKRDIMDCSNWLGITLLSISSKSRQNNLHADE